jgi:type IV pilus assembly protein PilM
VATNRIGVRAFDMAGIEDDRQLANAVRFRAHEAVSIPINEAVLDYHVVTETVDAAGAINRRIVLAVAYRESIDRFIAACKAARIELLGIDLEAFALLRAVAPPSGSPADTPAAIIAVTVGHDRTTLAISDGDVCDFSRVLEWGGSVLTAVIASALRVTIAEAEEVKLALALDADGHDDDERTAAARQAVKRELQGLARELVATLHFYQSQPESLAIGEIVVAGGATRMPGFTEELARVTRVAVRPADPLARVAAADTLTQRDDLASLAVAIGLGVDR